MTHTTDGEPTWHRVLDPDELPEGHVKTVAASDPFRAAVEVVRPQRPIKGA
jgi:hypothetical protein